jgi:hypothetical protein
LLFRINKLSRKDRPFMKSRVASVVKNKFVIVVAGALLAAMLLTGLPYALAHGTFFSLPQAHASGPNPIQIENSKPGTPGWDDFSADLSPTTLSGFGSQISVNQGDTLTFYVTTTAPSFTIDIYRTGYYQGIGARLIESLGSFPGLQQPIPAPDPVTGLIACTNWQPTTSITIPSSWVSGVYLAKLTSSTGYSSFIFFVVRDDSGSEDILFQTSVTTYEAYNTWGGLSLYNNDLTDKSEYPYPHATKVSFDRPFNPGDSNGAGHYLWFEFHFVYWLEEQGYDVAYTTDVDTDARPTLLLHHKAFLSVGHDEYWSMGMRNAVQNAINAGVNIGFFSANAMYWQIRFEPNSLGVPDRVEVGYKDFATFNTPPGPDPMWNVNNSLVTTNWRDPVVDMPENGLEGVMFEQQEDANYAYVVENASNWIYAGTGFVDGTSIPGIVGYEYDRVYNNGFTPPGLTVLSNSPVNGCCGGYSSFANSTLYTAPSGARVFAAGTMQWSWGLANVMGNTYANAGIQQTTANILNNFIGASVAPTSAVSISSDSLSFGNQGLHTTSAVQTVKVTNNGTTALTFSNIAVTGTNAGDFAQTNTCSNSLAVNASCTINVTFTPTASGARSGAISLTDSSAQSPQVIVLSGTGIGSGSAVGLSAGYLSFGNQTVGTTSSAQTVTVTNTGIATLTFSYIQIQGLNTSDFTQTNTCPTNLAVGASCTITVTFTPTATSTRAGNVTLIDNASDSPETIVLSGTGLSPNPGVNLNPTNISFGNQDTGTTSSAQTVTLTNNATSALTISSIAITGTNASDFAQTNNCPLSPSTLAANASCTISVTFTPQDSDINLLTAGLVVTDNGTGSPQTVTLSGTGIEDDTPGVNLSPNSLSFGNQTSGTTSSAQTVTLTNTGTAPLAISNIAVTGTNAGDFAETDNCPASPNTLAANASCQINVTFTPGANGTRNASVAITDNTDGEGEATQTVVLTGTGVAPTMVYFSDGFESGSLSQWSGGASGTGTATVESTVVNSGSDAVSLSNAAGQSIQISTSVSGLPSLTYTRFYFNLGSVTTTTLLALGQDGSGHNQWIIYYDSGRQGLDIYFWNGAGTRYDLYSTTNVVSANTWYEVEVEANETSSGGGQVWLNGESIGSFSGDLSEGQGYSTLVLTNQVSGTLYFDDAAIASGYNIPATPSSLPGVALNPSNLNFGSQGTGTTSSAQTVTLTNSGTSALTINGITVTGTNASDFAQTNTCPGSLAVGASCLISVTFTPSASGARSASISIADNANGSPQAVTLSGTGSGAGSNAYFSDGFESGSLSQWSGGASGTGTATVESTVVNSGSDAVSLSNAAGQSIQISTSVSGLPSLTYTRFYFNLGSVTTTTLLALGQDGSGHNQWIIYYDSGRQGLDIYFWNGAGTRYDLYSTTNVVSANTWYEVEVEANETSSGGGQVWLNGESIGSFSGDLSEGQGYSTLVLTNQVSGTLYFDDVAISGSYNGLVSLSPNSPILDTQILPRRSALYLAPIWVDRQQFA